MTMANLLSIDIVVSILVSVYRHQHRAGTPTVLLLQCHVLYTPYTLLQ